MIRKLFLGSSLAVVVAGGAPFAAHGAELRGIALSAGGDSAQVVLDLSEGAAGEKLFTLGHPDRVVLDLPHTHPATGLRLPAAAGVVTAVRIGSQPHGTLRVVVQLRSSLPAHGAWGAGEAGRRLTLTLGEPLVAALSPPAAAPTAVPAVPAEQRRRTEPASAVRIVPRAADTVRPVVHAAHAPGDGERDIIVAVDAGHGGDDPGAIGHGGTREKDVTLAIARALAARIDAEPGMRAVLTRDRDEFLKLPDRIARGHAARADLFISIHADSIADRSISGASVYVLSAHGASSEAARLLAERENAVDLMGGVLEDKGALTPVLLDEAQIQIIGVSATAAERVVSALEGVGELRKAQVQRAGFVVLKSPEFPSMLVETAYISNPAEERRLRSTAEQARLADAIAGGLRGYFLQNPPDGTRFKQERRTLASAADAATATTTP